VGVGAKVIPARRKTTRNGIGSVDKAHAGGSMAITTTQRLLTGSWTADVDAMETAVGQFNVGQTGKNDCQVSFFEVASDAELHVNVTHKHPTRTARGWAGPGSLPGGFVHNRTFGDTPRADIIRHIREMVFAARV
jgi:hypothetical protein